MAGAQHGEECARLVEKITDRPAPVMVSDPARCMLAPLIAKVAAAQVEHPLTKVSTTPGQSAFGADLGALT